ncbi:hypothetical protein PF003_g14638 [Phytophthora fragariae]|nr:hypothetical protein PF003_g14638 [Phytophthora fragariae]
MLKYARLNLWVPWMEHPARIPGVSLDLAPNQRHFLSLHEY